MSLEFDWDPRKAAGNRTKHGIRFEEAITVFADPLARIFPDPDHSKMEARELIIGHSSRRRVLIASFAERNGAVRLISARLATTKERQSYEEALR